MSSSSGQFEEEFTVERACRNIDHGDYDKDGIECPFEGIVDAWFDPEISRYSFGWTCPTCNHDHREDIP